MPKPSRKLSKGYVDIVISTSESSSDLTNAHHDTVVQHEHDDTAPPRQALDLDPIDAGEPLTALLGRWMITDGARGPRVPSSTMHPSPRQPLCHAASPPIPPNPALPALPAPFAPPACSVDPPLSNAKSETSTTTTAPSAPSCRRVAKRTRPRTQASASASASAVTASHAHGMNVTNPTPTQAAASRTPTPTPTAAATPTAARPSTPDFGPFASVLRQINTDLHVFEAKRQQDGFDAYFGLNSGAGAGESPLAARGAVQIASANDDTGASGDPRPFARSNSATAPANLHRWQLGELAARLELGNVDDCDSLADLTRSIIILPDTNDNELEYAPLAGLAPLSRSLACSADDEREPDDENEDHNDANTERGEDELISLPSGQGEYEHASYRDSGRHQRYDHANELGLGLDALSRGIISPSTGDYDDYHDDDQDRDLVQHLVIESEYTPAVDDRISHHGGGQEADESFSSYTKADNDMDQDSEAEVQDEAGDGWRGIRSISLPLVDENRARAQINEIMQRDRTRLHHGQSLDHSIGVEREQTGVGVGVGIGIGSRESHVLCGSGLPSSLRRLSVKHHDIHHHFYHHHHHHHHHYRHEHEHQQGHGERERARALEQGDGSAHARVDKNEYEHELLVPAIHRAECSGEGEEKLETTSIESVTAPARVPPPSHSMDKVDGRDEEDDKSEKATPVAPSPTRVADHPLVPVVVVTPFVSVAVASPPADPFQPLSGTPDTATPDPSADVALSAGDAADISISTYAEEGDRSSHSLGGRRREALSDASEQLYVIKFRPPNIRPITPEPQSELDKILADRRRVSGATSASSSSRSRSARRET